ncbi:hypothetical protein AgCh_011956 [Apium graveolens]
MSSLGGMKLGWVKLSLGFKNLVYMIQERLDRGLATQKWINLFPQVEVQVLDVATSDHLPLFLHLNRKVYVSRGRRFKFENVWLKEKECESLVKESWESTRGQELLHRINTCCLKLIEWGGGLSQEYKHQLADYRLKLRKLRGRRDISGIHLYNEARWQYLKLLEKQEIYWKQRSKQFWLQEGDQNTRFFHRHASVRNKSNCFQRIQDENGIWREKKEDIQHVVTDYFTKLFTSTGGEGRFTDRERVNQITEEENESLMSALTFDEVKQAVFSMHPDKSAGQDGLNPAFFQSFWSIVAQDVFDFCRIFIESGELPVGVNRTILCLILKVKVPTNMKDLRPISLCNVLLRILSKVLSNRLKACLGSIISNTHSAFVEGILLTDNAIIAFEVMEIFGFNVTWINRVMKLIQSLSYGFLYDGYIFGDVVPRHRVRQGDLISPYIYIMCAEGLSAMLRRTEEVGLLHGYMIARGAPTISHLLFADDCYFFFKTNGVKADVLRRVLNRYEEMSGHKINYAKSTLTFSPNTSLDNKTEICNLLGVNTCQSPGKYLGMPMVVGRNKCSTFSFLSERVEQKLEEGGLGFKSLRSFNTAMLAKQAWRLINEDNPLVTRLMRACYFPDSDFFNAKLGTNPSYVWRSILESQEVILQGCRRRIGDGISTKIWQIPWLLYLENGFLTTDMPEELRTAVVAGLFNEEKEGWDEEILNDICNERDRDLIKQIPVSRTGRMDSWFWLFDEHGTFTVRSCYRCLRGESECVDRVFWKKLWSLKLPGKVLNLVWRACRGCLPKAGALCCFAKKIWESIGFSDLVRVMPNDTVLMVLRRAFQAKASNMLVDWQRAQQEQVTSLSKFILGEGGVAYFMSGLTEWFSTPDFLDCNLDSEF